MFIATEDRYKLLAKRQCHSLLVCLLLYVVSTGKTDSQPQKHFLPDPTIIPKVLAQVLPTAVERHSQYNKIDLQLFTSSLIISRSHLRLVVMEELRDVPFEALLDWMIKLLVAYRITVDNSLGDAVPANQSSRSEYIFFPILGQHVSGCALSKELREEFSDDIWELYVHIGEPISAAFYYEFLALLIQGSFECQSQSGRVNCFRISSCGQLATVCFHAKNSPMYFKLMTEFHGLQQVIEIKMRLILLWHLCDDPSVVQVDILIRIFCVAFRECVDYFNV